MYTVPGIRGNTIGNAVADGINSSQDTAAQGPQGSQAAPPQGSQGASNSTVGASSNFSSTSLDEWGQRMDAMLYQATYGNSSSPIPTTINDVSGLSIRTMLPAETGADSVGNVQDVVNNLSYLSPYVLNKLSQNNIQWVVVPSSADQAFPNADLTNFHPTGWPNGMHWGDVGGVFLNASPGIFGLGSSKDVVIGTAGLDGSFNVALHENGHGWDSVNGYQSQQANFLAAYNADVPLMTTQAEADAANQPWNSDAYYLQGKTAIGFHQGASESYAESFARFVSGDSTLQEDWPNMYKFWVQQNAAHPLSKY